VCIASVLARRSHHALALALPRDARMHDTVTIRVGAALEAARGAVVCRSSKVLRRRIDDESVLHA
jgi:hypothetical protein